MDYGVDWRSAMSACGRYRCSGRDPSTLDFLRGERGCSFVLGMYMEGERGELTTVITTTTITAATATYTEGTSICMIVSWSLLFCSDDYGFLTKGLFSAALGISSSRLVCAELGQAWEVDVFVHSRGRVRGGQSCVYMCVCVCVCVSNRSIQPFSILL